MTTARLTRLARIAYALVPITAATAYFLGALL